MVLKRRGIHVKKPFSIAGRKQLLALGLPEVEHRLKELELVEKIVDELDLRIMLWFKGSCCEAFGYNTWCRCVYGSFSFLGS